MEPSHTEVGVSRRQGIQIAAAGAAGLAAALAGASTAVAGPVTEKRTGGPCVGDVKAGDTAFVAVTATTLWVEPRTFRPDVDAPSLGNPVDLDAWNANMVDAEARRWLTGELETQAVLGSRVIVDEVDGDWARIVVPAQPTPRDERGYPGWVPAVQLVVDPEFEELAESAPSATITALTTSLSKTPSGRQEIVPLSFDTILPVVGRTGRSVKVAVPGGRPAHLRPEDVVVRSQGELPPRPTAQEVIATGKRFLGLRYLWAGVSAFGYDCSGYTYSMLHHHGITIHRDAGPQLRDSGMAEVAREDLQPGDLVFFLTEKGAPITKIRHCAFYVGDDKIMQAPNADRNVEIVSFSEYAALNDDYAGARRPEYAS